MDPILDFDALDQENKQHEIDQLAKYMVHIRA